MGRDTPPRKLKNVGEASGQPRCSKVFERLVRAVAASGRQQPLDVRPAPCAERLQVAREVGRAHIEQRIRDVDEGRAHYLKLRFGKEWHNPHLYDLMISSGEDEERTARVIEFAMGRVAEGF